MHKTLLALGIGLALCGAPAAYADDPVATPDGSRPANASPKSSTLQEVQVTATVDKTRTQLSPEIGVSQVVIDKQSLEALPMGVDTPVNQVLLQAPGVVNDSFGQVHVRGDHGDLQYRINGVIIPESISGFGQTLDTNVVQNLQLLTGALPAQYGYRTAGIVEITTKSPAPGNGGTIGLDAGSYGSLNPSAEFYGSDGGFSYYLTGNFLENDIGIENPTSARNAIHDHTNQLKTFGYLSYLFNDGLHLSAIFGSTNNRFEIPNNPGQMPAYQYLDLPGFDSSKLDERQREITRFGVLALQGSSNFADYQIALSQRYSSVGFTPDPIGDLVFNGVASQVLRSNRANGLQADFSTTLGNSHTLRYGLYVSNEHAASDNTSAVFPADANANQTSATPFDIVDNSRVIGRLYGVYAQDEWNLSDKLTMNYGLRADKSQAYVSESQLSPRLGFVYNWSDATTLHAGYARYFTPAPTELISATDIALFQGTTNQLPTDVNAAVKAERSNYFDAGISQKVGEHLSLGLDGYYREVHNLLDEGQFGAALIFSPFNYDQGRVRGVEFSANYTNGDLTGYLNLSSSRAMGKNVVTGQYNFAQNELDYIATHWVHLDHDQRLTSSGGVSYNWNGTKFGADFLYGSGLRHDFANSAHLPEYYQVNLSVARDFDLPEIGKTKLRLAVLNATDKVYPLRDGSGIGVGAPQFGPRRGVFVGLTKEF